MKSASVLALVLGVGLSVPASAGDCHGDIAAIDKAMATAKLSDPDMAKVRKARASAEQMDKAKDHEGCKKALLETQSLLNVKHTHK